MALSTDLRCYSHLPEEGIHFLNLPAEVRTIIYDYVFKNGAFVIIDFLDVDPTQRYNTQRRPRVDWTKIEGNLIFVSRLIYAEARPQLASSLDYMVDALVNVEYLSRSLREFYLPRLRTAWLDGVGSGIVFRVDELRSLKHLTISHLGCNLDYPVDVGFDNSSASQQEASKAKVVSELEELLFGEKQKLLIDRYLNRIHYFNRRPTVPSIAMLERQSRFTTMLSFGVNFTIKTGNHSSLDRHLSLNVDMRTKGIISRERRFQGRNTCIRTKADVRLLLEPFKTPTRRNHYFFS